MMCTIEQFNSPAFDVFEIFEIFKLFNIFELLDIFENIRLFDSLFDYLKYWIFQHIPVIQLFKLFG